MLASRYSRSGFTKRTRLPAKNSFVRRHGFKMRRAIVVKNFESQFRNSFSRSTRTCRKERRYSIAGWPHFAHQCPCNSAPQFSQCVSAGVVSFAWRRPGVRSNALIAVSPRMIFAGSSAIQHRCYKTILFASTQHKHTPAVSPKALIDQSNCLMTRSRPVGSQLFKTKSPDHLMAEAASPERQMKRTLTAFDLTCIGIGAVIGTGIFALIGTAISGQTFPTRLETPVLNFIQAWLSGANLVLGRSGAGPAITISLFVAALACGFAALSDAELASMIPVSGSAYTYSYATLGELIAWIIGWDLILEYAVGNMAVAVG